MIIKIKTIKIKILSLSKSKKEKTHSQVTLTKQMHNMLKQRLNPPLAYMSKKRSKAQKKRDSKR